MSIRSRSWIRRASSRSRFARSRHLPAGRRASRRRRTPGSTRPALGQGLIESPAGGRPTRPLARVLAGRRVIRLLRFVLLMVGVLTAGGAAAGHELTFYPSFYPQEITLGVVDRGPAAALLAKNALQAYVGADPFSGSSAPAHVTTVESLSGFAVLRFNRASPTFTTAAARCAAAAAVTKALATVKGEFVIHPYPVTPYHADYLAHI